MLDILLKVSDNFANATKELKLFQFEKIKLSLSILLVFLFLLAIIINGLFNNFIFGLLMLIGICSSILSCFVYAQKYNFFKRLAQISNPDAFKKREIIFKSDNGQHFIISKKIFWITIFMVVLIIIIGGIKIWLF